ncbi:hypothetical protein C8R44DRAFT_888357 [Mycena epipterygia]|nr:hypothetical protein C8R44DRAFT_888357 [Mycena epipterygia]
MSSTTSVLPSSSVAPTPMMNLLIPMPVPRTSNAPYFDGKAGITDADALVDFIVRYSSDRVRAVIQYHEELDPDEPNRTWVKAHEQMLLLYGCSDEERRCTEQELIDFCREQSAKHPFGSKLEVEQYLRGFQYIAGPLMKAREITTAKRDYYFVSGIPSVIKEWFIARVPEHQRTRSNPIPLVDSVQILYDYFDPDALFPDLWEHLKPSPKRVDSPASHASYSHSSSPLTTSNSFQSRVPPSAPLNFGTFVQRVPTSPTQELLHTTVPIAPAPVFVSPRATIEWEYPVSAKIEEVPSNIDPTDTVYQDSDADADSKVPPSSDLHDARANTVEFKSDEAYFIEQRYAKNSIYHCWNNETADRVSAPTVEDSLAEAPMFQDPLKSSVQLDTGLTSPAYAAPNELESSEDRQVNIEFELWVALERYLKSVVPGHESQMSSVDSSGDTSASTSTDGDIESTFDSVPGAETNLDTDALSSFSEHKDSDRVSELRSILVQVSSMQISANSDTRDALVEIERQVKDELNRCLAGTSSNYAEVQLSSIYSSEEHDSRTITDSEVESIFDHVPEPETDTDALSSYSDYADSDRIINLGTDSHEDWPPRDTQAIELDDPIGLCSDSRDPKPQTISKESALPEHLTLSTTSCNEVSDHVSARISFEHSSLCDAKPTELEEDADLFLDGRSQFSQLEPDRERHADFKREFIFGSVSEPQHSMISFEPSSKLYTQAESQSLVSCVSYVDYFVPELFDLGTQISYRESVEYAEFCASENEPPSYQESISASTSGFTHKLPQITAEYLANILFWIPTCLNLISRWFTRRISVTQALVQSDSESADVDLDAPSLFFHDDLDYIPDSAATNSTPPPLCDAKRAELDTASCAATGINSTTNSPNFEHIITESQFSIPCSSYVDLFVPELFDIQTDIHVREPAEFAYFGTPDDDPPGYPRFIATSMSSFSFAQVQMKAEYLQFIIPWLLLCWNLLSRVFFRVVTALRAFVHDNSTSEADLEQDFVAIEPCSPTDDAPDFRGQDSVEISCEPVPPDKSLRCFNPEPHIHSKNSSDSELMYASLQDTNDPFPTPPQVQVIERDHPPRNTDSDLVHQHEQNFQHDLRKSFISFEPSTEYPSNNEPFKRAESQHFLPCASYVDYFVPELFEPIVVCASISDRAPAESTHPEDDPPSYEQSISTPQSSFAYARPRLKAEYLRLIPCSISLYLDSVLRLLFKILSRFSVINEDVPNINLHLHVEDKHVDLRDAVPHSEKLSTQETTEIPEEPVTADENSKPIFRNLPSRFSPESLVLFPNSTHFLEFSQEDAVETDVERSSTSGAPFVISRGSVLSHDSAPLPARPGRHSVHVRTSLFFDIVLPVLAGLIILYKLHRPNEGGLLVGYYLLAFLYGTNPLIAGSTKKSVVLAGYNTASSVGNIVEHLIQALFRDTDAPLYRHGLLSCIGIFAALAGSILDKPAVLHDAPMDNRFRQRTQSQLDREKLEAAFTGVALGDNALLDLTDWQNDESHPIKDSDSTADEVDVDAMFVSVRRHVTWQQCVHSVPNRHVRLRAAGLTDAPLAPEYLGRSHNYAIQGAPLERRRPGRSLHIISTFNEKKQKCPLSRQVQEFLGLDSQIYAESPRATISKFRPPLAFPSPNLFSPVPVRLSPVI